MGAARRRDPVRSGLSRRRAGAIRRAAQSGRAAGGRSPRLARTDHDCADPRRECSQAWRGGGSGSGTRRDGGQARGGTSCGFGCRQRPRLQRDADPASSAQGRRLWSGQHSAAARRLFRIGRIADNRARRRTRADDCSRDPASRAARAVDGARERRRTGGLMIRALVVDDEEPARERLGRLLSGCGVEVVAEAADGHEALTRIDELAPDLVFLDIQMPGLSGLDVARNLRPPRPRVVFCTAFDRFAIDAFEHHAVDYLLKPVNRDRLARTVTRVSDEIQEQRRLAREQDEAVRTQARLLPTSAPSVPGLDCAGACRPAHGVSGDYYDFLTLGPTRVGVALGDVSGKGTFAGLLGAALQARLQTLASRGSGEPARLLEELNRLTVGTMEGNRF